MSCHSLRSSNSSSTSSSPARGVRTNESVTTSRCSEAKYSSWQRASRAVISTASENGRQPAYAAAVLPPKLGPAHSCGAMPISASAHSASARQLARNATCAASV